MSDMTGATIHATAFDSRGSGTDLAKPTSLSLFAAPKRGAFPFLAVPADGSSRYVIRPQPGLVDSRILVRRGLGFSAPYPLQPRTPRSPQHPHDVCEALLPAAATLDREQQPDIARLADGGARQRLADASHGGDAVEAPCAGP
jgi:hypothetical protein